MATNLIAAVFLALVGMKLSLEYLPGWGQWLALPAIGGILIVSIICSMETHIQRAEAAARERDVSAMRELLRNQGLDQKLADTMPHFSRSPITGPCERIRARVVRIFG